MFRHANMRWGPMTAVVLVAWLLGAAPVLAQTDAISREVTYFVSQTVVTSTDANSREVTFFVQGETVSYLDANSREITFFVEGDDVAVNDAISREFTFYIPGPDGVPDAISREYTFQLLGTLALRDGYIGQQLVTVPADSVRWMALAVAPAHVPDEVTLYVAAATQVGPAAAPDDFIYRAYPTGGIHTWLTLPEATADPVGIAVSPGGVWAANSVYVALNEALGAATGPAVMRYDDLGAGTVVAVGSPAAADPHHIAFTGAGYPNLLYWANGEHAPGVVSVTSSGQAGPFTASPPGGVLGLAFNDGSVFDAGLYLGGEGRTVYLASPGGQTAPLSADLGSGIEALAFGTSHGFEDFLYALLHDGRVVRIGADGTAEEFLSGITPVTAPDARRNDLCFSPGGDRLFVTDAARKVVYAIQMPAPVGVDDGGADLPSVTALRGNYPNPFNPATTIRFDLAAPGPVTLDVYDVAGRQVRSLLARESLAAGQHSVLWDGRDGSGRPAAAGIYLVRLQTAGGGYTGKIALVK